MNFTLMRTKLYCDGSCTCKLGTLFVSAKYVLVSVKLACVYVKLKKNLNTSKRGIFIITEKTRVVFAKYNWIGDNFKISEGWFCKHIFFTLPPVKKMCIYPKVSFVMVVLKCVC
jgi:hypothetical protein